MCKTNLLVKTVLVFWCFVFIGYSSYKPLDGADYAEAWCSDGLYNSQNDGTCSPYKVYPSDDCANFVSQCLKNGGMDLSDATEPGEPDACGCITGAADLEDYLSNSTDWQATTGLTSLSNIPNNLSVGDVVVWHGTNNHATIVVTVNGSTVLLAAHTTPHSDAMNVTYQEQNPSNLVRIRRADGTIRIFYSTIESALNNIQSNETAECFK
jgi:hypothetical protein